MLHFFEILRLRKSCEIAGMCSFAVSHTGQEGLSRKIGQGKSKVNRSKKRLIEISRAELSRQKNGQLDPRLPIPSRYPAFLF